MKKLIALLLSIILVFSLCSVSAFAEEKIVYKDGTLSSALLFINSCYTSNLLTENELATVLSCFNAERLKNEKLISNEVYNELIAFQEKYCKSLPQASEYSFGQGTFVVGLDLKPGTYDITCESSSGNDMDSSMAGLSDFYNSQGMSEYADMFDSMSGMYDTIGGLTIMTYKPNTDYYDQYLTLKVGETARIIMEDGGKIEISDGTAKLVWIR